MALIFHSVPTFAESNAKSEASKTSFATAAQKNLQENKNYDLNQLALPSEVQGIGKSSGSIYYSPTEKGKVLMPVHLWGAIGKSGVHYIPFETSLINGLSIAGGPQSDAKLSNIKLTRKENGEIKEYFFDLSQGGNPEIYDLKLQPGDTIYVDKSTFSQDRAYYTSLFGVIATILSTILIFREVRSN